jgi:phage baseplate assembly protein W
MAQIHDRTDLFWTSRGDIKIGGDADLMDTEYDPLRSFVQEIETRVAADQGDWKNFPNVGSGISDFVGEPNNAATAEAIKTRVISALARDGFIRTRDMKIKYMPVDIDKLLLRASFKVAPTARNVNTETLVRTMLYSYSDNNVYFVR